MTAIAMHLPQMELHREESFSTQDDDDKAVALLQLQQQQFLELERNESSPELEEVSLDSSSSSSMEAYKTVRFSLAPTTIHEYIHRSDITAEEKAAAFLTMQDLMHTKQEMLYTRELVDQCIYEGDNLEFTKRGLELRMRKLVRSSRSAVMHEQHRQSFSATGSMNQILIASRYALTNHKAAVVAAARGKKDHEEVTNMYLPERLAKEDEEGFGYYGSLNDQDDEDSESSDESCSQDDE